MTKTGNVLARRRVFRSDRGASAIGCLFFLVVVGALGYVGVKVGGAYWDYFDIRQRVRESLNWAVAGQAKTDAEISQKVAALVRQAGVELNPKNIKISHSGDNLTIEVSWTREIELPSYTFPLHFSVNLTEIKRWVRGGLIIR